MTDCFLLHQELCLPVPAESDNWQLLVRCGLLDWYPSDCDCASLVGQPPRAHRNGTHQAMPELSSSRLAYILPPINPIPLFTGMRKPVWARQYAMYRSSTGMTSSPLHRLQSRDGSHQPCSFSGGTVLILMWRVYLYSAGLFFQPDGGFSSRNVYYLWCVAADF